MHRDGILPSMLDFWLHVFFKIKTIVTSFKLSILMLVAMWYPRSYSKSLKHDVPKEGSNDFEKSCDCNGVTDMQIRNEKSLNQDERGYTHQAVNTWGSYLSMQRHSMTAQSALPLPGGWIRCEIVLTGRSLMPRVSIPNVSLH